MCGIVGAVAERNITAILLEGLKRLEYRGYDSAGVAVFTNDEKLERRSQVHQFLELVIEQVGNDFGVSVGGEHIAECLELLTQRQPVGDRSGPWGKLPGFRSAGAASGH